MKIEFPILTVPSTETSDFLDILQKLADSDFKKMILLSPFVDAHIIKNIISRCIYNDKRILIVTRYKKSLPAQKSAMDKAQKYLVHLKNYTLKERIRWEINEKLHAKCVICDWNTVLFGSQNLTEFGGLGYKGKGNYESGMFLKDLPDDYKDKLKEFVNEVRKNKSFVFYPRKER